MVPKPQEFGARDYKAGGSPEERVPSCPSSFHCVTALFLLPTIESPSALQPTAECLTPLQGKNTILSVTGGRPLFLLMVFSLSSQDLR